jgi:hypothetical protein
MVFGRSRLEELVDGLAALIALPFVAIAALFKLVFHL